MKQRMQVQIQPRHTVANNAEAQRDIDNFLHALNSYPARAAKEPRVSFHQYLRGLFADDAGRGANRTRPH